LGRSLLSDALYWSLGVVKVGKRYLVVVQK